MAEYMLYCLGNPRLELDGKPVKLEMRKALALLVNLRMTGHNCPRESLAALFWPEYDQQHAQANLRRTLASLNKSLQTDILEADREILGLRDTANVWLDVEEFLRLLSSCSEHPHSQEETCPECQTALESAIQLYRGDFLEGFNLNDCPEFDEWQLDHRENLCQELGQALQKVAQIYASQSRWEPAIAHARRWVSLDRLHEPACRTLMDFLARSGQRERALRQFVELRRLLQEELGQEPEYETQQLYEQIRERDGLLRVSEPPEQAPLFPLLKTKLYIPSLPAKRVIRSALVHHLSEAETKTLTIISAPAGFGKTTLLAEWIAQTALPVAWISLDDGDNDLYRFLAYIIAALESIHEDVGLDARQLLQPARPIPAHIILASLINDLGKVAEHYALVLDDYQFITEGAVHEALAYLLDHLPVNQHVVIASRADPPLQLGRLRVNGQLLELRSRDIRFNLEEVAEFCTTIMRLALTAKDIEALAERTEGWIVGLKMAALALEGRSDSSDFIRTFSGSHRYVLDYLVEEVLHRQPANIQTFLLGTSILEKMNGSLCDAVMNEGWEKPGENGQAILEYLEKSNLFLIPLDENRQWYRYHHLFADLLHSRLKLYKPDLASTLLVQASQWFEQRAMIDEAVKYATKAKDYHRVIRLVSQNALSFINSGRLTMILGWLQPLPDRFILDDPWISTLFAWGLVTRGEMERAEPYLLAAHQKIESFIPEGEHHEFLGTIATLRALVHETRDETRETIEMGSLALQHLNPKDEVARASVKFALARAYYMNGNLSKAKDLCQEAVLESRLSETNNAIAPMASLWGFILVLEGKLNEAETVFRRSIKVIEERGIENCFVSGQVYLDLGKIMRQRNQLQDARRLIERGIELNKRWGVITVSVFGLTAYAEFLITIGDLETAEELVEKAASLKEKINLTSDISSAFLACQVQLSLAKDDPQAAYSILSEHQISLTDDLLFRKELDHITLARVLIALGKFSEAVACLHRLEAAAICGSRNGRLIEILVLQAIAFHAQAKTKASLEALQRSLSYAEPEGYMRIFLDEGEPIINLLENLQASKSIPKFEGYIRRLLAAYTPA